MDQKEFLKKIMVDFNKYVNKNKEIKEDFEDYILDLYLENKDLSRENFEVLIDKKSFYFEEFKLFLKEKYPENSTKLDYNDFNYKAIYENFENFINLKEL